MGQNYSEVAFECILQCVLGIRVATRKLLEERALIYMCCSHEKQRGYVDCVWIMEVVFWISYGPQK